MTSESSSLGLLGRLPPEVRLLIWEQLGLQLSLQLEEHEPKKASKSERKLKSKRGLKSKVGLGILWTCRQLYAEVLPLICEKEVLPVYITARDFLQEPKGPEVANHMFWRQIFGSLKGGITRGSHRLPWHLLKGIKIMIRGPGPEWDPGQFLQFWRQVNSLVEALEHAESLPEIQVQLLPTREGHHHSHIQDFSSWLRNGKPVSTFQEWGGQVYAGDRHYPDFEAVLMPFCRLRKARKARIEMFEPIDNEHGGRVVPVKPVNDQLFSEVLMNVAAAMMRKEPFGTFEADSAWSDEAIQAKLNHLWMKFDRAIDSFPDDTTSLLHWQRFKKWRDEYDAKGPGRSSYVDELERVYRSNPPAFACELENIFRRYADMRCWEERNAWHWTWDHDADDEDAVDFRSRFFDKVDGDDPSYEELLRKLSLGEPLLPLTD